MKIMDNLNALSEQLLIAVKMEKDYAGYLEELAGFTVSDIQKQLYDDSHKMTFWINIYNAFFQILRKDMDLKQPKIYTAKKMSVAGEKISLDDIEHGILRRYRYKYSLGYLPDPFVSALIKKWAVSAIDFRIHFALNCGAKSCPPIGFYTVEKLEEQLELAGISFLTEDTLINEQRKEAHVSKLFLWFLKDFGGKKGALKIVSKYLNQDLGGYKIIYNQYSWEEHLNNYDEKRFDSDLS